MNTMPAVYPFHAVQYARRGEAGKAVDLSSVVAPPYDVLDAADKQRLLQRDGKNIVGVDLPHVPPKQLGPPEAYARAAEAYRAMFSGGTLARRATPAMFAYRQTFMDGRSRTQRSGMACCIDVVPMGPRPGAGGVLPHEETFSGPKEDRLALMTATRTQLSPIFGLHADERGAGNAALGGVMSARTPDFTAATDDGTLHEVWTVEDGPTIAAYQRALTGEDVFIADGHHRYNTALSYLKRLEAGGGGEAIAADHPARRCMVVLVAMSDPGLVIWPTHRVIGGMADYSFDAFAKATHGLLSIRPERGELADLETRMGECTIPPHPLPRNVIGLFDFATGRAYTATLSQADPLAAKFPDKPPSWRHLDVAVVQHAIVEQVCQPVLNRGKAVSWMFPHTIREIEQIGREASPGAAQLAMIVRPTPLQAVREISRAGVLMPQKSTFFYPKLATGLFIHPLE